MRDALIEVLFTYDAWATRCLLEECRSLAQEQLERPLGLGHGTIERTLVHLIGAMMFFADRLNRQPPRARPDQDDRRRTPAELLPLFETAQRDLQAAIAKTVDSHAMTDILNWTDQDTDAVAPLDRITYAVALAQMIDHSIHHRTQVMDMIGLLGMHSPMDWHPFEWEETTRSLSGTVE